MVHPFCYDQFGSLQTGYEPPGFKTGFKTLDSTAFLPLDSGLNTCEVMKKENNRPKNYFWTVVFMKLECLLRDQTFVYILCFF